MKLRIDAEMVNLSAHGTVTAISKAITAKDTVEILKDFPDGEHFSLDGPLGKIRVTKEPQPIDPFTAEKARKWDELEVRIAKFYPDGDNHEDEDSEDGDLLDIGEAAAQAFGFL